MASHYTLEDVCSAIRTAIALHMTTVARELLDAALQAWPESEELARLRAQV